MADYTIVQGDTEPRLADNLSYSSGEPVELSGSTVAIIMRGPTATEPRKLTGTVTITEATKGGVQYSPTVADTSMPGLYSASWRVTFKDGNTMTFPTVGFLWIEIQPSLSAPAEATLVGLPELKDYLNIHADDRTHDDKLQRMIVAVRPLVENMAGPIQPQVYEEWHDGGNYFISLKRRPSTTFGTSPIYTLMACSEYRGPKEYPLSIITDPAHGNIYSCMFHKHQGIVERRTSGGGVTAFPQQASAVHVVYQAGQEVVPGNVMEATLEIVRTNYQTTQAVGGGRQTVADADEYATPFGGMFVPKKARELLAPNRRSPAIF